MSTIYFAIFHHNKDHQYEITFPDLEPNAATYGDTLEEAIKSAHDSLAGYLLTCEDFNEKVKQPSSPDRIKLTNPKDFLVPVQVDLKLEREKEENKLVKKTLTIPAFLNNKAKEAGLNFSALLSEAIKAKLNI